MIYSQEKENCYHMCWFHSGALYIGGFVQLAYSHCGRVAHQAPVERTHALGNQLWKYQTIWRWSYTAAFTKRKIHTVQSFNKDKRVSFSQQSAAWNMQNKGLIVPPPGHVGNISLHITLLICHFNGCSYCSHCVLSLCAWDESVYGFVIVCIWLRVWVLIQVCSLVP